MTEQYGITGEPRPHHACTIAYAHSKKAFKAMPEGNRNWRPRSKQWRNSYTPDLNFDTDEVAVWSEIARKVQTATTKQRHIWQKRLLARRCDTQLERTYRDLTLKALARYI